MVAAIRTEVSTSVSATRGAGPLDLHDARANHTSATRVRAEDPTPLDAAEATPNDFGDGKRHMRMNAVETALMNNPVRAAIQRYYEAPLLERLGGRTQGEHVLEVGCGRGVGTEIILERFDAAHVTAFDLDPAMVQRAQRRLRRHVPGRVALSVGNVTGIESPDGEFDAVFDFGIIHHVPDWRAALGEIGRVLRPGGRFYFEEVTRHALQRWSYRTFLLHPTDDRFSGEEFIAGSTAAGLDVDGRSVERFFGDFVFGVATRR